MIPPRDSRARQVTVTLRGTILCRASDSVFVSVRDLDGRPAVIEVNEHDVDGLL
jgi:hypothetical protein